EEMAVGHETGQRDLDDVALALDHPLDVAHQGVELLLEGRRAERRPACHEVLPEGSSGSVPNNVILSAGGGLSGGHPRAKLLSEKAFSPGDTPTSYRVGLVRWLYFSGSSDQSRSNCSRAAATASGSAGSASRSASTS